MAPQPAPQQLVLINATGPPLGNQALTAEQDGAILENSTMNNNSEAGGDPLVAHGMLGSTDEGMTLQDTDDQLPLESRIADNNPRLWGAE